MTKMKVILQTTLLMIHSTLVLDSFMKYLFKTVIQMAPQKEADHIKPQLQSNKTVSQKSLHNVSFFSGISRHLPPWLITASENCLKKQ